MVEAILWSKRVPSTRSYVPCLAMKDWGILEFVSVQVLNGVNIWPNWKEKRKWD